MNIMDRFAGTDTVFVLPAKEPLQAPPQEPPQMRNNSIEDALLHIQSELKAAGREKDEVRGLIKDLLNVNREKKELYRRQAEARMERQAHNTATSQVEADERETMIDKEYGVMLRILEKAEGLHPGPILLGGPQSNAARPARKPWWRRLLW